MKNKNLVLQSFIYNDGEYLVSTIYRASSVLIDQVLYYYETLVWKLSEDRDKRKLIDDNSGAYSLERAITQHNEMCIKYLTGWQGIKDKF